MISSATSSISYTGNNSTSTAYSVPFPFLETSHITVIVTDSLDVSTELTNGTEFTVVPIYDSENRITSGNLTTATAYASTFTVAIKRETPQLQPTDFVEGGQLSNEALESALDRITMISQETYRDATGDLVSGIVASGRTISAAADSGLSVTNGDGEAGNPTIDLDNSTLSQVTGITLADDKFRVEVNGTGSRYIDGEDLADELRPLYNTITFPGSEMTADASTGATIGSVTMSGYTYAYTTQEVAQFSTTSTPTAYLHFVMPDDYAGGDVKMRLTQYMSNVDASNAFVWHVATNLNSSTVGMYPRDSGISFTEYTEDANTLNPSNIMNLGSTFTAGEMVTLTIKRDASGTAADTYTNTAGIVALSFQYPSRRVNTAWS